VKLWNSDFFLRIGNPSSRQRPAKCSYSEICLGSPIRFKE
jgi:hypothetical protein